MSPVLALDCAVTGHGVSGLIEDSAVMLGNLALMEQQHVDTGRFKERLAELAGQGQTPVLLSVNRVVVGLLSVADPIKADSKEAIAKLREMGVKVLMVTGDSRSPSAWATAW